MHDRKLIEEIANEYKDILEHSKQSIYIFLDDTLKVCNKNFSGLLGYDSPEEWAAVETSFPQAFVAEESQKDLVTAYQDAMEDMTGTKKDIVWKMKNGEKVETKVILVPVSFKGHLFALHFVS